MFVAVASRPPCLEPARQLYFGLETKATSPIDSTASPFARSFHYRPPVGTSGASRICSLCPMARGFRHPGWASYGSGDDLLAEPAQQGVFKLRPSL